MNKWGCWTDSFVVTPFGKTLRLTWKYGRPYARHDGVKQESEWAPEPVWMLWRREKSLASARNRMVILLSSSLQPSHYTDWATPASLLSENRILIMTGRAEPDIQFSSSLKLYFCLSRGPGGLRRKCAAAALLGWLLRIPQGEWMFVSCVCCVLRR